VLTPSVIPYPDNVVGLDEAEYTLFPLSYIAAPNINPFPSVLTILLASLLVVPA